MSRQVLTLAGRPDPDLSNPRCRDLQRSDKVHRSCVVHPFDLPFSSGVEL